MNEPRIPAGVLSGAVDVIDGDTVSHDEILVALDSDEPEEEQ